MEKRVLLAVVLCGAVLVLWQFLFPPPPPPAPTASPSTAAAATAAAASPTAGQAPPPPGEGAANVANTANALPPGAAPGEPAKTARPPEELVKLETPDVTYVFSTYGATLRHAELRERKYREPSGGGLDLFRLLPEAEHGQLRLAFDDREALLPPDTVWKAERPSANVVVFVAETADAKVEKRITADSSRFRLHMDVVVHNKGAVARDHHLQLQLFTRQDPDKKGGSFLTAAMANWSEAVCEVADKVQRATVEDLAGKPFDHVGGVRWAAAGEKFFMIAAVPYPEAPPKDRRCSATVGADGTAQVALSFAGRTVAPGASTHYQVTVFAGPKSTSDLAAVAPGGQGASLDRAVDVSLAVLSRPLLGLLRVFFGVTGNWGVAIILLTVFVKILTFYPMQRSLMSGKRMQRLAPKLAAVRKKYPDDRQKQGLETMNLYKAHGVNPLGGCLPSLITMPIWIALYSTLNYSVELYRSPFALHIQDLTAKDPFFITPLLMGAVMYLQMRMSPAGPDPAQQKMMAVMMPIMFTGFSLVLPSGLAVYMLTSYLIGILQQLYVNAVDRRVHGPMPVVTA